MKKVNLFATHNLVALGLTTTALTLISASNALAATLNVSFTKLPGLAGGSPTGTAVYYAKLSDLGFDLNSIQIADDSSGLGGAPGKFSGFDLDAIKLSPTLISNAADINALPGLSVFNFSPAATVFTPGTQRLPADPALFGTTGSNINNTVATLGSFDGNNTTNEDPSLGSTAFGFASLGDNGKVGFNLKSPVSTTVPLYLYIGEVGDNGEVAAGSITVSDKPVNVPEPASLMGLSLMGIYLTVRRSTQGKKAV